MEVFICIPFNSNTLYFSLQIRAYHWQENIHNPACLDFVSRCRVFQNFKYPREILWDIRRKIFWNLKRILLNFHWRLFRISSNNNYFFRVSTGYSFELPRDIFPNFDEKFFRIQTCFFFKYRPDFFSIFDFHKEFSRFNENLFPNFQEKSSRIFMGIF